MRKRVIAVISTVVLAFSLCACSKNGNADPTTLSDGSMIYYSGNQLAHSMKTIPFDMIVEDKAVPFYKVSFFELYADHRYAPYLVVSLDRSKLTDDDVYWITKYDEKKYCKTLDVNVYAYSDKNELRTESMLLLGTAYDDEYIYYSFCGESQRYSFLDSYFSCQVIIVPTGRTESDTTLYYFDYAIDSSNYSDTVNTLTPGEFRAFSAALKN